MLDDLAARRARHQWRSEWALQPGHPLMPVCLCGQGNCDAAVLGAALDGEHRVFLAERAIRRAVSAERTVMREALQRIVAMREQHPATSSAWPPDNHWERAADDMAQIAYEALAEAPA